MLKKSTVAIISLVMITWAGYVIWSNKNRNIALPPADAQFRSYAEAGRDSGRGNLIGIQPYLLPVDYSSEEAFFQKLNGYFAAARRKGWLNAKSIVVLPENIGTWLMIVGEKKEVYTTRKLEDALQTVVYSNIFSLISTRMQAPQDVQDKASYSLLAMKAVDMANMYQQTFAKLASVYDVTIVAGSIILPEPSVTQQKLTIGTGPLYNVSGIFLPDGSISGISRKSFLSPVEKSYLAAGSVKNIPVLPTPAGKLSVLINQDSWFPEAYHEIRQKEAKIVAVPASVMLNNFMKTTWTGYQGYPTPLEAKADINIITEGEAWSKYSFGTRAPQEAQIQKGMGVFMEGELWDLGYDGAPMLLNDTLQQSKPVPGASLSCVWL